MSNKNVEMLKKILAEKKLKQTDKQKFKPNNKIGSSSTGFDNTKAGGSNNKV